MRTWRRRRGWRGSRKKRWRGNRLRRGLVEEEEECEDYKLEEAGEDGAVGMEEEGMVEEVEEIEGEEAAQETEVEGADEE